MKRFCTFAPHSTRRARPSNCSAKDKLARHTASPSLPTRPPGGTAINLPQLLQSYHRLGSSRPHTRQEGFTVSKFGNLETSSLTTLGRKVMCSPGRSAGLFLTVKLEYVRALSLYLLVLYNYPCAGGVIFKTQWS